ncbi:hypothetical protein BDV18DRAFT_135790, partial [Aspergillus unguis]
MLFVGAVPSDGLESQHWFVTQFGETAQRLKLTEWRAALSTSRPGNPIDRPMAHLEYLTYLHRETFPPLVSPRGQLRLEITVQISKPLTTLQTICHF